MPPKKKEEGRDKKQPGIPFKKSSVPFQRISKITIIDFSNCTGIPLDVVAVAFLADKHVFDIETLKEEKREEFETLKTRYKDYIPSSMPVYPPPSNKAWFSEYASGVFGERGEVILPPYDERINVPLNKASSYERRERN